MKEKKYYLDTGIWLDFLEDRDEPNFPKSVWAKELMNKIIKEGDKIVYSDNNLLEMINAGYSEFEVKELLQQLKSIIIFVEATKREIGKAKDLGQKRDVPKRDALHALIARNYNAILITHDNHFKKLTDITKPFRLRDFL